MIENSEIGIFGAMLLQISSMYIWVKVFKNGPSKIGRRQPLKGLKWYGLLKQTISLQIF